MNVRITVTNEKEQAITLYLEPWAEEHVIEPNVSLELVGSGPPGEFEVAACQRGMTVYGFRIDRTSASRRSRRQRGFQGDHISVSMDWVQVIECAAKVHSRAAELAPAVAKLFEEGLRGAPREETLQRAYGVTSLDLARTNPFADALSDAAYRESGQWRPQTLAAVRGCLRLVPGLMLDLFAVFRGDKVLPTQGDGSLPARLSQLGASGKLRWLEPRTSETGHWCPRCGFLGVRVHAEKLGGRPLMEAICPACAAYGTWEQPDDGWPRVDDLSQRDERLAGRHAALAFFRGRGDDPFATPTGFTISRKLADGMLILIEIYHRPEHRIYLVLAGLPLKPVADDRRTEVKLALMEINREIAVQGFMLHKRRIGFRTHAYTNADGSISARVLSDTVEFVVGVADEYLDHLKALSG